MKSPACIPVVVPQVNSLHRSVSVGIRIAYQQRRPSNVTRARKARGRKHGGRQKDKAPECHKNTRSFQVHHVCSLLFLTILD